jgi:hypothetical protein
MANVRFSRSLKLPPVLAREALSDILHAIAAGENAWRGFALHVELAAARLPDVGFVAIPIRLKVDPAQPGINQLRIEIEAAQHPASFPNFGGSIGIDAVGTTSSDSMLWFAGTYELPMGFLGALVDTTLASGIADRCLENFVDDVTRACQARVNKSEAEFARYRHFGS